MPQAGSASTVTPARWELGLSWTDFVKQSTVNVDKLEGNFSNAPVSADDIAFLKKCSALSNGPKKILALAEAWCGDVYRELPVMARWAEEAGIPLRVFPRDANADIMDEFLYGENKSRAIPVFVFYTQEMGYITHFTERSATADAGLEKIRVEINAKMNLPPGTKMSAMNDTERQAFLVDLRANVLPLSTEWQKAAIQEIRGLLSSALQLHA